MLVLTNGPTKQLLEERRLETEDKFAEAIGTLESMVDPASDYLLGLTPQSNITHFYLKRLKLVFTGKTTLNRWGRPVARYSELAAWPVLSDIVATYYVPEVWIVPELRTFVIQVSRFHKGKFRVATPEEVLRIHYGHFQHLTREELNRNGLRANLKHYSAE